jgi:acyl transferase domain-containing protein/NADPH:quinone reductase-like Zn-dependent oxidoreductase/acyl carrier protein
MSESVSPEQLAVFREAFVEMKNMRARLDQFERGISEPIAVIGIGCRFPGGGDDPDSFWRMLREGVDAVTEVPRDRFDIDAHFGDGELGTMVTRSGSFLRSVDGFDAGFFGISPREADSMDPQQRLLLEVTWEALERAGQAPGRLTGSQTGVFVGFCNNDYFQLRIRDGSNDVDPYFSTGVAASVAAGRLSYVLGLNGPCMTIDTACSSSLVAVHSAVQSLRSGECRMALAGGVNLMLTPLSSIALSALKMLAPDGRCKTFDAAADGFSRGEGCGVVVLKKLSDALAGRDPIVAVIRGSAVNQDGRSSGLTAPNGPAQEAVIRRALQTAGIDPARVSYVEAHGTGTPLGDPIEIHALRNVLGEGRPAGQPLIVGSLKTNMGHLEAAAGIAGLLKLIVALQHREIPPHLHLHELNPHIVTGDLNLIVPQTVMPWDSETPRVGGVSSFGFSGTNAHVIVEEAPLAPADIEAHGRPLHLLPLSAKSAGALQEVIARMRAHLAEHNDSVANICYSAAAGRAHFAHRAIVMGATREELDRALEKVVPAIVDRKPKIAFLFSGQGSQFVGMARELYETQPSFRASIDRCEQILGRSIVAESRVDDTEVTQPLLFTIEWSLASLWRSWGVEPSFVMGHSIGEYVAACVAGAMTLEQALPLVAARGQLMAALDGEGAMVAVLADEAVVQRAISGLRVDVAARNGRENIVISGARADVDAAVRRLGQANARYERLRVSEGFHSSRLDPMLEALRAEAGRIVYAPPGIPIISNVTGARAETLDSDHWVRHARGPVEFARGMRTLEAEGIDTYIEIGAGTIQLAMGRRAVVHADAASWLPSLRRGRGDWEPMLETLATLYTAGAEIDWAAFDRDYPRRKIALPTYPFQRERYWIDLPQPAARAIDGELPEWIAEHRVDQEPLVPAAAYLALAPVAALKNVSIARALPFDASTRLRIVVERGSVRFLAGDHLCATASVGEPRATALIDLEAVRERCTRTIGVDDFYDTLRSNGLDYGPRFRGITALRTGEGEALAQLAPGLHRIARIDAALQVIAAALMSSTQLPGYRPVSVQSFDLREMAGELYVHATLRRVASDLVADLTIVDDQGRSTGSIAGVVLRRSALDQSFYRLAWHESPVLSCAAIVSTVPSTSIRDERLASALDAVAVSFAQRAVESVDPAVTTRPRLYARLREIAAKNDLDSLRECDRLLAEFSEHGAAIALLRRGGSRLAEVLRGEIDPLEVLFPAADRTTADVYGQSPAANAINDAVASAFATIAANRRLRVIEIGGGTGATTRALMPHVRRNGHHYLFTDVSPHFLGTSRRDFGDAIDYATLDIEREPAEQGLANQTFDVVIAANVLHATADLRETLANVRRLLAPGGDLLLVESDPRDRWLDLTFGLTDGWWRFRDSDLRSHPLLSTERWLTLLRECGFDDAAPIEGTGVIVARAARPIVKWLVVGEGSEAVASSLRASGQTCDANEIASLTASLQSYGAIAAVDHDCIAALKLVQRIVASDTHPRLVFVTHNAQHVVEGDAIDPDTAQLWGMARTIALEHPDLRCFRVDADDFDRVGEALLADDGEDQIAIRNGRRLVARLEEARVVPRRDVAIVADGTYLITGGLRGLGLRFARHLVSRGARQLVLVGRGRHEETDSVVAELRRLGAVVAVEIADVADHERMRAIIEHARATMPPLRGVIHAAGVLDDGVITQLDEERFQRVLRPKVDGARNLDQLTRSDALDFFVLFSSAVSILGAAGQSNHAAANAFLDALAERRRAEGLTALSISWGAWSDVGAAARLNAIESIERQGAGVISTALGLAAFDRLIRTDLAHVAVMPLETSRVDAAGASRPVMRDLVAAAPAASAPTLAARLRDLPKREALTLLRDEIRAMASVVLGIRTGGSIDSKQPLNELGLDSLMAVELRNALASALDKPLPATLLFDHPTIDDLVAFLGRGLTSTAAPASSRRVQSDDPIAIVGMGCRFPGGANDPESFWQFLRDGGDGVVPIPESRWKIADYYDPTPGTPGRMYATRAGFVDDVDRFDPEFFRISPREAASMDPQQRMLLEVTWEALEHAGQSAEKLMRSDTGVFIGICSSEYAQLASAGDPSRVDAYSGSGGAYSVAAGRLSYFFGFEGPSIAVDTACSSSLVSVHLAAQSLRSGECGLAVAGGVNLMISPLTTVALCAAKMLAADGRCKTFDASADGFVRGEGCGVVILKRLSDAARDGDRVLAVIRGTAVNQDGRSAGLTAPNGPSQEAVIGRALQNAGVAPAQVGYVEAHGTGTTLGDPIELQSLAAVLREGRSVPLYVGSVKTNIGHLEAAAGVAGLIKTVLALQKREIPPHLHFTKLNPNVALDGFAIEVPRVAVPWPVEEGSRRIAGISSFSFSGTNAHIVLEEAPAPDQLTEIDRPLHLLAISATDEAALRDLTDRYAGHLDAGDDDAFADICSTALRGRSHFPHRLAVVASSRTEARERLAVAIRGVADDERQPTIAFVFHGEGMDVAAARKLSESQPSFRRDLERCEQILGRSISDGAEDHFVIQWALASLWRAWGIEPSFVVADGAGELVAACFEGRLTVEEALALLARGETHRPIAARQSNADIYIEFGGPDGLSTPGHLRCGADWREILETLAALYVAGVAIDWDAFDRDYARRRVALPTYPFQRERYWVQETKRSALSSLRRVRLPFTDDAHFEVSLTPDSFEDHRIDGRCVVPAAYYIATVIAAVRELTGQADLTLEDLVFLQPLMVDAAVTLHIVFTPALDFRIAALHGEEFVTHAEGRAGRGAVASPRDVAPIRARFPADAVAMPGPRGILHLGPDFRRIEHVWRGEGEALARIDASGLDAGFIDSLFQLIAATAETDSLHLPFSIGTIRIRSDASSAQWAHATSNDVVAFDDRGEVVIEVLNFRARPAQRSQDPLQEWEWMPADRVETAKPLSLHGTAEDIAIAALSLAQEAVRTNSQVCFVAPDGDLNAAVLRGFAATVAIEHPELRCCTVDGEGARLVPRLRIARAVEGEIGLATTGPGLLENLTFQPRSRRRPETGEVEIAVRAAGLNFRDVLNALGLYPGEAGPLGGECAGVITAIGDGVHDLKIGDEVVGLAAGAFATHVVTPAAAVVKKPAHLSFEDAAAMPVAFLTAAYALEELAEIRRGHRVLIHAAAGGVGLAALQIAQRVGAEVFATAGTEEKRARLRSMGVEHVASSRDLAFAKQFRDIDIVLNSLNREFVEASLDTVSRNGCFLEIGKIGVWSPDRIAAARPDVAYHLIALEQNVAREPDRMRPLLARVIAESAPLPKTLFDLRDAEAAFRYMQQAKHVGKIVLTNPGAIEIVADGTYLVTGGTRGIGLATARHLVDCGARQVVVVGRNAPQEPLGDHLIFMRADVAKPEEIAGVLDEIRRHLPPLRGVVHAAGVIDDGVLIQQTAERFARVLAPKVAGARHLHELTLADPLDFFVLYSSLAGLFGSAGQSAYSAANAYLDALAQKRRASGLPAVSIAWSAWAGTGMAAQQTRVGEHLSINDGLALFDRAIRLGAANVAIIPNQRRATVEAAPRKIEIKRSLLDHLQTAVEGDRKRLLIDEITRLAARVLATDAAKLADSRRPLNALGLDSLMAVELRNAIAAAIDRPLPATLLFDYPSIDSVAAYIECDVVPELFGAAVPSIDAWIDVDRMTEEETERALIEELDGAGY